MPSHPRLGSPDRYCYRDPAPSDIYPLSLHDALPIFGLGLSIQVTSMPGSLRAFTSAPRMSSADSSGSTRQFTVADRKSTRLNSSHVKISYAVFCLKKK